MRNSSTYWTPAFARKAITALLLSIVCVNGFCQTCKIDSLKSLVNVTSDFQKANLLYELAFEYASEDYHTSLKYAREAFGLAQCSGDSMQIVKTGRLRAYLYRRLNQMDSALITGYEVLPIARRNEYRAELKSILNGLANANMAKAYFDKALLLLFESLELKRLDGDKFEISVAFHNIGLVYYKLTNVDDALYYYKQSLVLKEQIADKYDLNVLLVNIGLCYLEKNRLDDAKGYIQRAFSVCGDLCSDNFLVQAYFAQGRLLLNQGDTVAAEKEFRKSHILSKTVGDNKFQLDNIIKLTEIYINKNQLSLAENFLGEAEALIEENSPFNFELIGIHSQFIKLYTKGGNLKRLAFYQGKYISLRNSIYDEELTKNLMAAQAEFQERQNKAQIQFQGKILALDKEIIYRQQLANVSIGGFTILLVLVALILANNNRQKRRLNDLLDQKVKERTIELEMNRDALERAWHERDLIIAKASNDIRGVAATIKGLCFLGLKEIDHPNASEYLNKMSNASDQLSEQINKMWYLTEE